MQTGWLGPAIIAPPRAVCTTFDRLSRVSTSRRLITPEVEALVHQYVRKKAIDIGGIYVHELGGIETHVHVAVSIEPTVTISGMVGLLKGYTAHEVNQQIGRGKKVLEWQAGYGVVSFGTRDLPWVLAYVQNQKEHHQVGRVYDRLEWIEFDDDGRRVAEAPMGEVP